MKKTLIAILVVVLLVPLSIWWNYASPSIMRNVTVVGTEVIRDDLSADKTVDRYRVKFQGPDGKVFSMMNEDVFLLPWPYFKTRTEDWDAWFRANEGKKVDIKYMGWRLSWPWTWLPNFVCGVDKDGDCMKVWGN